MTDFNEYIAFTTSTAKYPNVGKDAVYPVLKLTGEAGEVFEKVIQDKTKVKDWDVEIIKELGDCYWYIARLTTLFNLVKITTKINKNLVSKSFDKEILLDKHAEDIILNATKISELTGKVIRDSQGTFTPETITKIENILENIIKDLMGIGLLLGYTVHDVLEMNISKLSSRKQRGKINGSGDNR